MATSILSRYANEQSIHREPQSLFKTKIAKALGSISALGLGAAIAGSILLATGGTALSLAVGVPLLVSGGLTVIGISIYFAVKAAKKHMNQKLDIADPLYTRDHSFKKIGIDFLEQSLDKKNSLYKKDRTNSKKHDFKKRLSEINANSNVENQVQVKPGKNKKK